jgi:hypothetical protein
MRVAEVCKQHMVDHVLRGLRVAIDGGLCETPCSPCKGYVG